MREAPLVLSDERTVVVGVDGTLPWRPAVAWAAAEAFLRGAVLRVVHVGGAGLPSPVGEAVDWVGATHPTIAVRAEVLRGPPSTTLVEAADTAELLVVGAHRPGGHRSHGGAGGRDAHGGHRLGSVARYCVGHAACPVVVVRTTPAAATGPGTIPAAVPPAAAPPATAPPAAAPQVMPATAPPAMPAAAPPVPGWGLVVGVDGSPGSDGALRWAFEEARRRDLPVLAVHAWQPPLMGEVLARPGDASEKVAAAVVAGARTAAAAAGWSSRFDAVTVVGAAVPALVEASAGANLLVVGARGHGWCRSGLAGSVAWRCAEEAACPVAVVRGGPPDPRWPAPTGGDPPLEARARYPSELEGEVTVAGGGTVHVRPIRSGDAPALVDFHRGLSDRTVYRRFFFDHPVLAADEVARFTSVDYARRLAMVAEDGGRLVAVARYDAAPGSGEAELAFVVADDHQHRGIGTALFRRLVAAAAERDIPRFVAYTQPGNHEMLGVLTGAGIETTTDLVDGVLVVRGPTTRTAPPAPPAPGVPGARPAPTAPTAPEVPGARPAPPAGGPGPGPGAPSAARR